MPTYAYACKQCDHRFDAVQSFSDPSLTECPVCGGELRKQYGSIGVTFNGSGFYRTDSRADGKGSQGGGAKSGGETGGADKGSSTPSKSEAKSDTKSGSTAGTASGTTSKTPAPSGS